MYLHNIQQNIKHKISKLYLLNYTNIYELFYYNL